MENSPGWGNKIKRHESSVPKIFTKPVFWTATASNYIHVEMVNQFPSIPTGKHRETLFWSSWFSFACPWILLSMIFHNEKVCSKTDPCNSRCHGLTRHTRQQFRSEVCSIILSMFVSSLTPAINLNVWSLPSARGRTAPCIYGPSTTWFLVNTCTRHTRASHLRLQTIRTVQMSTVHI